MLGPVRVHDGTDWVPVAADRQRLVLAVLLAEVGRAVTVDLLVDALWGDRPPGGATNTVRAYVMRLRRLLGDSVLATRSRGYELVTGRDDVDAIVFERLTAAGRQDLTGRRPEAGVARLARALALWQGPVLADVPPCPTLATRVAHLDHLRLAAEEDHAAALVELGRSADAVERLYRLVDEQPLREQRWVLLMRALDLSGRRGEALEAFQQARRILRDELGLEPGPQLRGLQAAVLTIEPPRDPAIVLRAPVVAQLPADVVGFTGRDGELKQLDALLSAGDDPQATAVVISAIAGMAGVGKTALAVNWAHRVRDRFPDGQLYLNLRGYTDGPAVRPIDALSRLLAALGLPADRVPLNEEEAVSLYRSMLANRRMLVVLDNANHPDQVRPLLPTGAGSLALITSRDQLGGLVARDGAVPLELDVLSAHDAGALLTGLLGPARPDPEGHAIARLARLCGYLPLALRIAAANLNARPHSTLVDHIERLATDPLNQLGVSGDPQSSVRIAFQHSYVHQPETARRLFRVIGLLPGPDFADGAAAALADLERGEVERLLDGLVAAHLVHRPEGGRYTLHDLIRFYARAQAETEESVEERTAAVARLLRHYLDHVTSAADLLYPQILRAPSSTSDSAPRVGFADVQQALAWLESERTNLVAAVGHASNHGPHDLAWRLADALRGHLYLNRHTADWEQVAAHGVAAAQADGDLYGQATSWISLAMLRWTSGDHQRAIEHHTTALALTRRLGWDEAETATLSNLGNAYAELGQLDRATVHYRRALRLDRRAGRRAAAATKIANLGAACWFMGQLAQALDHDLEALAEYLAVGDRFNQARTLRNLGHVQHALGRMDDALASLTQALTIHRDIDDRHGEANTMRALAVVHRDLGHRDEALDLASTALPLVRAVEAPLIEAAIVHVRGSIQHALGRPGQALDDHAAALRLARETRHRYTETEALIGLATTYRALGLLDAADTSIEAALAVSHSAGYRMLEGNALTVRATIQLDRDQPRLALEHADRAGRIHAEVGHTPGLTTSQLLAARARERLGDRLP